MHAISSEGAFAHLDTRHAVEIPLVPTLDSARL